LSAVAFLPFLRNPNHHHHGTTSNRSDVGTLGI
jgi:hypothetical protein